MKSKKPSEKISWYNFFQRLRREMALILKQSAVAVHSARGFPEEVKDLEETRHQILNSFVSKISPDSAEEQERQADAQITFYLADAI
jgi:hypothetical protein